MFECVYAFIINRSGMYTERLDTLFWKADAIKRYIKREAKLTGFVRENEEMKEIILHLGLNYT